MNLIELKNLPIYIIGDIHGEFKAIANWIKQNKLSDCYIIFCGDFGLGFDGEQKEYQDLLRAEKVCTENNVMCYIIRGNHDNPDYYNNPSIKLNLKRFKPLSDYSIIKSPEHTILCLGGAVSTDRSYRQKTYEDTVLNVSKRRHCSISDAREKVRKVWWEKEPFIYDDDKINEIINSGIIIDTICSHAAPSECFPITSTRVKYWEKQDETLTSDLTKERQDLSKVWNLFNKNKQLKNWYYGHYHGHNLETIDGTTFHLLDMGRNGRMSGDVGGLFDMTEL